MNITYISSTEIIKKEQLKEIFRDRCGIEVDGRIYTSIPSITDISYLIHLAEQYNKAFDIDTDFGISDINTEEFKRINKLANEVFLTEDK